MYIQYVKQEQETTDPFIVQINTELGQLLEVSTYLEQYATDGLPPITSVKKGQHYTYITPEGSEMWSWLLRCLINSQTVWTNQLWANQNCLNQSELFWPINCLGQSELFGLIRTVWTNHNCLDQSQLFWTNQLFGPISCLDQSTVWANQSCLGQSELFGPINCLDQSELLGPIRTVWANQNCLHQSDMLLTFSVLASFGCAAELNNEIIFM